MYLSRKHTGFLFDEGVTGDPGRLGQEEKACHVLLTGTVCCWLAPGAADWHRVLLTGMGGSEAEEGEGSRRNQHSRHNTAGNISPKL